jgi:hypothetical protein
MRPLSLRTATVVEVLVSIAMSYLRAAAPIVDHLPTIGYWSEQITDKTDLI